MKYKADVTPPTYDEFQSWYDPLDLFSGEPVRVRRAVAALCADWATQEGTNLKILYAGRVLTDPELGAHAPWLGPKPRAALIDHLTRCLLAPPQQKLLRTLVQAQQRYDPYNIEGLASAWHRHMPMPLHDADTAALPPASLAEYEAMSQSAPPPITDLTTLRACLVAHMMSATLKDLSLFIHLTSSDIGDDKCCLSVVDVDAKPMAKLHSYARMDAHINKAFADWHAGQQRTKPKGDCAAIPA